MPLKRVAPSTATNSTRLINPVKQVSVFTPSNLSLNYHSRPRPKKSNLPIRNEYPTRLTTINLIYQLQTKLTEYQYYLVPLSLLIKEIERPVSTAASTTGGYRLLNAIGGSTAGATAKNAIIVNKFKSLGSTQYAKNQIKEEQLDGTELPHSFGSPRKYQQIQHDLKYEGGDFYQNAVSAATVSIKVQPPSPPAAPAVIDGNCTKFIFRQLLTLY